MNKIYTANQKPDCTLTKNSSEIFQIEFAPFRSNKDLTFFIQKKIQPEHQVNAQPDTTSS